MEYSMEHYYRDQRDADAAQVFNNLRLELSCRENNEHVGSGMGGSPTDYLFLLTHQVNSKGLESGDPYFEKIGEEIFFRSTKKPGMKKVREALTHFLAMNYPNRMKVTQAQLLNPSFLRDLGSDKLEVKLLIKAVEHTYDLVKWLDLKLDMQRKLWELSSKERDALASLFLKEMGLPESHFEDHKDDKLDPMSRMLRKHPVWGTRREAVSKRYGEMVAKLLSPEDDEKLLMIGSYPAHITLFVFRSLVQIERMVALNLDERSSCNFLNEINKSVDGEHEKDSDS